VNVDDGRQINSAVAEDYGDEFEEDDYDATGLGHD
jgi:hypothetical protein